MEPVALVALGLAVALTASTVLLAVRSRRRHHRTPKLPLITAASTVAALLAAATIAQFGIGGDRCDTGAAWLNAPGTHKAHICPER